ncbi:MULTISPECIES: ATP-binding protein [unclassified Clostridium]|mgnify:CR=1 FL=1|uniref:ATP-binding protein n=1 Tax=unclassified Clostridium TaxID=2614128 RepID=UPI001105E744|nr:MULTISPECIES: ATP-binding protein [unclassified Clostridium]
MTLEDILKGESKNVEFKSELPKRSDKYMKSIIAFSNTSGGKLMIGIDDKTRTIIGVDKEAVFYIMDSIANGISDCCEPQIIPDITFQTIDGKCIVIVEIYPGANRPYYLKHIGKEKGTYLRVAGTSRPADQYKIKELELEGLNLSWDELTCVGYHVSDEAIEKLCQDIHNYMVNAADTEEEKNAVSRVTKEQLLNWKILKKAEGEILPTNAFVLLTSDYFPFAKIQCALFKGMDRDEFIDKKEFCGPLYEQIEGAYQFVLRHISRSAEIDGLVRKERYELPIGSIREMIINAQCHRNFMDNSCVQVALYDDRLEVTSPGMLYGGLTLEEAMSGRSKIRNRAVAEVFSRMELIEEWGTGIRRILKRSNEYGLPKPDFFEIGDTFRVNLYRLKSKKPIKKADKKPIKKADKGSIKKTGKKPIKTERQKLILNHVKEYGMISNKEARAILGLAESTTKRILKQMSEDGILQEQGERRARIYILK